MATPRTASRLIAIAASWVGYHEKASNSQLDDFTANSGSNNWNLFAKKLHEAGYYGGHNKNSFAWCECFVDYCFLMLCDEDREEAEGMQCQTGTLGAACPYSAKYYKAQGRLDSTPRAGDQVFFGNGDTYTHTGIVEKVDTSYIYTIEGNSGDMVKRHTYSRSSSYVRAFGHPYYEEDDEEATPAEEEHEETTLVTVTTFMLQEGSKGTAVAALQALLNMRNKSGLKVDSSFGPKTRNALKAYQTKKSLTADAIANAATWESLLNVE